MKWQKFVDKIKKDIDKDIVNNIEFKFIKGCLHFYPITEPTKDCILMFNSIRQDEYEYYIKECVERINSLYR